ncbi:hypothetical protein HYV11_02315 [Candidatus Dependentiae bacterium]|nr:hypothetical protein [Candidatus Dependentiae bacterium]
MKKNNILRSIFFSFVAIRNYASEESSLMKYQQYREQLIQYFVYKAVENKAEIIVKELKDQKKQWFGEQQQSCFENLLPIIDYRTNEEREIFIQSIRSLGDALPHLKKWMIEVSDE